MILKNRIFLIKKMMLFILILYLGIPFFAQDLQEPLKYKVSVNVKAVPLFAVDTNGNPVFDLKEKELQLYINGKPVDILQFRQYEFGDKGKAQDRVFFIILDTMFNSLTSFRRSKEISINLIKEAPSWDRFVILENSPSGGLKYVGGLESNKKELIKKIKRLYTSPEKWNDESYPRRLLPRSVDYNPSTDPRLESETWKVVRYLHMTSERYRYKHQVKYFTHLLSQFKYALRTIAKPKVVFLISEGIATGAFKTSLANSPAEDYEFLMDEKVKIPKCSGGTCGNIGPALIGATYFTLLDKADDIVFNQNRIYSAFLLNYLLDVVKSINYGGSVLYTINPKRTEEVHDDNASGEVSLRYLASESGGKYFAGSKPEEIIERVKKTTAAYYELFFTVLPDMGSNMSTKVKCKRKGVRVHSLIHSERNRPYISMEPVQKKIFALNVATGGSWSRMVGKVMKVKYKKAKSEKKGEEKIYSIHVPLPKVMQGQKIDMFSIRMNPKTQETAIDYISRKVKDVVKLKIKRRKGKNQFFAIIEPTTPYCIYNKI